jgi:hypothetical protein
MQKHFHIYIGISSQFGSGWGITSTGYTMAVPSRPAKWPNRTHISFYFRGSSATLAGL